MTVYTVVALTDPDSDEFYPAAVIEGRHPAVERAPDVGAPFARWCGFVAAATPERAEGMAAELFRYQLADEAASLEWQARDDNSDELVAGSQAWPGYWWVVDPNGDDGWSVRLWNPLGVGGFTMAEQQPTEQAARLSAQLVEDERGPSCGCGGTHWSCY